ncbi:bifunctional UDP-N-acetylglucosamine diphosphorylase/glucosamine-1-phosphate N-acetyltransferase GlmU [Aureimonas altamirensis]|uniref:bifunctional UDP-N-acetylglucosamine diphosphorylase/glucosamine-1-phosphate N-acetyltransferase GlmU n=1 Tax=Aureimonas altamirensis TaxID=370622 RepID=UPI00203669E5|nr:bifunctional UDP-N-acetylglucosamine diphosphorylase/glucosamine-1-phosphate N-acetyltransferase GlmU [Aureimonas altamirensis]MCM2504276.1 bifunctional UDP-N-acetylglucosamine diphosphorylase/glucosamine-1-phosphate N-acetyltransferase GlmU [Aureimonas altamirensis]
MSRTCLTIILAAGEGTRMKSSRAKVLHPVAGLPLVCHVAAAAEKAGADAIAVVTGRDAEAVEAAVAVHHGEVQSFRQIERLGTAHAVLAAAPEIERGYDDILVLFGDTPLLTGESLAKARGQLAAGAGVVVFGFHSKTPTGYGRLLTQDGELLAIREEKDASPKERAVTFCNGGLMAMDGRRVAPLLRDIGNGNAKGEYYLTDIVALARAAGERVVALETEESELQGVNDRADLACVEAAWQARRREEIMEAGVTMIDPATIFLSFDTRIGADCVLEPNVFFGPGVSIGPGCTIHAFCHIEGATLAGHSEIGPFARLRPGTELADKTKVGNFCETKNAKVERGAKINHLSYIGDARVGAEANIGAGTITCNYDGALKHHTDIGAETFIGSNSSLVAPITIGDGAYVASGSVVTEDVPADALAFGRARQVVKEGRGLAIRQRNAAAKAARNAARQSG